MTQYLGLVWLGILIMSAWAILNVLRAPLTWVSRGIWVLAILVLPIIGAGAWFLVGQARARV